MSRRRKSPVEVEQITPEACSLETRLQVLRGAPFFASLPDAEVEAINRRFREYGYVAGETIYRAGEPAAFVYIVAVGKLTVTRHTADGQEILLDVLAPGDFLGSLSPQRDAVYVDSAQARTAACVLAVATDDFRDVMAAYPTVALAVLDAVSRRLATAQALVQQLSAHSAEQRVAFTLLRLADSLGQSHVLGRLIQMPISREDLANMAGTTPETASRVLSQFRKAGWIRSGRQWIAVREREPLRSLAGDALG